MSTHWMRPVLGLWMVACAACGDDVPGFLTDLDPTPPEQETPPPPPILGDTVIAVDLDNRLIVFGSESTGFVSRAYIIRGVPFFSRIVGIAHRPSSGVLYGVGNDSRVYTIDPWSGVATAVASERFSPIISSFFEIHFGMAFDPGTEQIYLVSAESRSMWIINPDNGSAVAAGPARFAEGDIHENAPPSLTGLAYLPGVTVEPSADVLSNTRTDCEDLLYAIDPDLAWIVGSCDPDKGDWISLVDIEQPFARCTSIGQMPDGNVFGVMLDGVNGLNQWVEINLRPTAELVFGDAVPDPSPIQSVATRRGGGESFDAVHHGGYGLRSDSRPVGLSVGADGRGLMAAPPTNLAQDALARCTGGASVLE